jgi:hypothetical protein
MPTKTRLVIVVNKSWECDPVCWVLTNSYLADTCNIVVPWPVLQTYPSRGPVPPLHVPVRPRLVWNAQNLTIEVWCISDLLSRFPPTSAYQSSSQCKMDVLEEIFAYSYDPVELVVAVGTASSGPDIPSMNGTPQTNINGSVVVGSHVFLHDGHPASDPNPDSQWRWPWFDMVMPSSAPTGTFVGLAAGSDAVTGAFLCPPTHPADNGPRLYVDPDFVAIGDINVTDYSQYAEKDEEAGTAYEKTGGGCGVSLETTHGLIYAAARDASNQKDPLFLFVSGVVDRYTKFSEDVKMPYAQNVAGAHNAGVVVAQLIARRLAG